MIDAIRTTDTPGESPDHPVRLNYADSAAWLKQELKRRFPKVAFRVRGSRGTARGWTTVEWTDGPTVALVREVTGALEGTTFDGMTDSTDYHETRAQWCPKREQWVRPWLKSVNHSRHWSDVFTQRVAEAVSKRYNAPIPPRDQWSRTSPFGSSWSAQHMWDSIVWRAGEDRTTLD